MTPKPNRIVFTASHDRHGVMKYDAHCGGKEDCVYRDDDGNGGCDRRYGDLCLSRVAAVNAAAKIKKYLMGTEAKE